QALQQIARFWRRKCDVRITGITGSVGKSTTKEVAAEVLSRRYSTLKNTGNLNNEIGLPLTILGLRRDHQRAVLEMGFYVPGEIKFLCDIALPHVGMLTNIGTVHAERTGSQAEIARGKAELVEALPPEGVAILNYDDPLVRPMAQQTQAKVLFYGLTAEADLWADEVQGMGLDGIRFRLHYAKETFHLRVPMIGRHSVHTALRAAALGLVEGLSWQEIFEGLRFSQTQLRLVSVFAPNGALLLDDTYNASPQSTLAAINLLDELEGRKIAVLGDMLELGPYERQGHEMVGIRAAAVADELVTVGERARMISAAARNAGLPDTAITELQDTQAAIDFLRDRLQKDDIMLVKGSRGMHMDTIVPSLEAAK
ncbi:MAG: UDP-N-acetylmuramoyl-tripeptide--D-alanyl-D-alanine ligase, partial [Anaerolineae bacterium]|nr:UDP-N-acetylmuramoyl-tripeptide--D-alanyl-D-alanine ligase [Anaerolineae bacterium]